MIDVLGLLESSGCNIAGGYAPISGRSLRLNMTSHFHSCCPTLSSLARYSCWKKIQIKRMPGLIV